MESRDYAGEDDLLRMQRLAAECWRLEGPYVSAAVGDPAWWMYQHLDKLDEVAVRVWPDGDGVAAWAWLWRPGALMFLVHPDRRADLVDRVLDWFEAEAEPGDEGEVEVHVLDTDSIAVAELRRRGFELADTWLVHLVRDLGEPIPEPEVPAGYVLRAVAGDEDVERRVDVHRAAFAPSRVVPESYRQVMRAWPYRAELDRVVEAPDGSFASFALAWLDEGNGVGELEPVGTHPDHRRRGLARAVCFSALAALREAGARTAVVYGVGGSDAERLYLGLGFRQVARHVHFRRETGKRADVASVEHE